MSGITDNTTTTVLLSGHSIKLSAKYISYLFIHTWGVHLRPLIRENPFAVIIYQYRDLQLVIV